MKLKSLTGLTLLLVMLSGCQATLYVSCDLTGQSCSEVIISAASDPGASNLSNGTLNFGSVTVSVPSIKTLYIHNGSETDISELDGVFVSAGSPFSFNGSIFPGTMGDCSANLSAKSSCHLELVFESSVPIQASNEFVFRYRHRGNLAEAKVVLVGETTALPNPQVNAAWTWISGSDQVNSAGDFGSVGVTQPTNRMSARRGTMSWQQSNGRVWIFGGFGLDAGGSGGVLNDLWKYENDLWTWVKGSSSRNQNNVFGVQGTPAPANTPGSRQNGAVWIDALDRLWVFGGDSWTGGVAGDLWRFNGSDWAWVAGSNTEDSAGVCGVLGVAAPANTPGARSRSASWRDGSGAFWLFGGAGFDCSGSSGRLNDLWKYESGQWTHVSGSPVRNTLGSWGTIGVADPANIPGPRENASVWQDSLGNVWLFGGVGLDLFGSVGTLNDLWKFDGNEWTWMSGSNLREGLGSYGSLGTASTSNVPGAREQAATWRGLGNTAFLFGGLGCSSASCGLALNDLWKFDGSDWIWISGSNSPTANETGVYGALGVEAPANLPGSRALRSNHWSDTSGNLWFFGGYGYDAVGTQGSLNDLWHIRLY